MSDNPTPEMPRRVARKGGFAGRYTTTIILVGVLVVLAGALFLLNNNPNAGVLNATPTPTPPPTVWDLSAGTTQGVTVQTITQTVAFQIINNHWQITAPTNEPGDDYTIGSAAEQMKKLQATQVITAPQNLDQYGLVSPAITITMVMSGTPAVNNILQVGGTTIDGGSYYAKPAGQQAVYVVQNTLIEQMKGWLTTLPVAQPTPTPIVIITPSPTPTDTPTPLGGVPTETPTPAPPPAAVVTTTPTPSP